MNQTVTEIPKEISQQMLLVLDSLANHNIDNAYFLAQRLYHQTHQEEYRQLLVEILLQHSKYWEVIDLVKDSKKPRDIYIYLLCLHRLGENEQAEQIIQQEFFKKKNFPIIYQKELGHIYYLFGQVKEKLKKEEEAKNFYNESLKVNPYLYCSLEALIKLSSPQDIYWYRFSEDIFTLSNENIQAEQSSNILFQISQTDRVKSAQVQELKKQNSDSVQVKNNLRNVLKPSSSLIKPQEDLKKIIKKNQIEQNKAPIKKILKIKQEKQIPQLFAYVRDISLAYINLDLQNYQEAKHLLTKGSLNYQQDFHVQILLAKIETEQGNIVQAEKHFQQAYSICPNSVQGYSFYSSCLWQLKKQQELSRVSSYALEKHFFNAETWIALSNCYSLSQDYDLAISYLKRSMQLDPFNSYTYCLAGHEYSSKEQYDKSKLYYKKALSLNSKNIRAYWGMGNLHLKTESYQKAIEYFQQALAINKSSAGIYTQIAIAYMNIQDYQQALQNLLQNEKLCAKDSYNLFYKVSCLYKLQRYQEALENCQVLLTQFSNESQVCLLMGQILQELRKYQEAHGYYVLASEKDKSNTQKYKTLIEGLNNVLQQ